jgi:hypothetical protein
LKTLAYQGLTLWIRVGVAIQIHDIARHESVLLLVGTITKNKYQIKTFSIGCDILRFSGNAFAHTVAFQMDYAAMMLNEREEGQHQLSHRHLLLFHGFE